MCIPPCHVAGAKKYVGDRLRICTVIGFPNGYNTPAVKAFEAAEAIRNGADEVDMVINLAMVKDGCWDDVAADIRAVREVSRGRILKVIIECCLLTEEEKRMLCRIVSDSGADYIKTSTGFSTGGATADDVRLLRTCCPPHVKVKAAGGIASLADAEEFIRLGADRLGTSSRLPRRRPRRSSRKRLLSRKPSRTPLTDSAGRRAFAARSAPTTRRGWQAETRTGNTAGRSARGR